MHVLSFYAIVVGRFKTLSTYVKRSINKKKLIIFQYILTDASLCPCSVATKWLIEGLINCNEKVEEI